MLDLAQMRVSSAVTTIVGAAQLDDYQPSVESERAVADLALRARVQATLLRKLGTPSLLINVFALQGTVHLGGTLSAAKSDQEIRNFYDSQDNYTPG